MKNLFAILCLLSSAFYLGAAVPEYQRHPLTTNTPNAITNVSRSMMYRDKNTLWVDPNGNDTSAVKGNANLPYATPHTAIAAAGSNDTVVILPGVYQEGTNIWNVPHYANLINHGTVLSYADLNTNGVFCVPGSYSTIHLGEIRCDTNQIKTRYDAGVHSGYWAALGSMGDVTAAATPNQKCYTNATITGGRVLYATSDGVYVQNTNGALTMSIYNTEFHGYWDLVAALNNNSAATNSFYNCYFHSESTWFLSTQNRMCPAGRQRFYNCTGVFLGASATNSTIFHDNVAGTDIQVFGGYFCVPDTTAANPYGIGTLNRIRGSYSRCGTNFSYNQLIVGNKWTSPTNSPTSGYVMTATGTAGDSAWAAASGGSSFAGARTLWVDPNGNNSTAVKGNFELPWATPSTAISSASSNETVVILPGTYNEGTNLWNVPHHVNILNYGTILSSADMVTNGVFCVPGSYSTIYLGDIQCDTNQVKTRYDAGTHSGYWAGLGTINDIAAAVTPAQKCYTNAVVTGGRILNGTSDGIYVQNTSGACTLSYYNLEVHSFWDCVGQFNNNQTSTNTFYNCYFHSEGTWWLSTQNRLTPGGRHRFHNCKGVVIGAAGGTSVIFGTSTAGTDIQVFGGYYESDGTSNPYGLTTLNRIRGNYSQAGTNVFIGTNTMQAATITLGNFTTLVTDTLTIPTNAAPADAVAAKYWIAVTNSNDGGVYKVPLYQ